MAKVEAARGAQWPLVSEFSFRFDDTIEATDGVVKPLGGPIVADVINLPEGAVVIGGELVVEVPDATATTWTMSLGDSASANRYGSAVSLKAAGRTALTLTGYRVSENLRATIAQTGSAPTAGQVTVRVMFVMPGRANEVVPN
ncbi:MAG: hypothetical protein LBJ46_07445 [Planctomycetota bacterium]|jgi:hypothetical protein|nr:hypothetical protein [Planctomycetota bacterium]